MRNIIRRIGFPLLKTLNSRRNRPNRLSTKPTLGNELLEKRELLAADFGFADPSMAIFYALSRGGEAMMARMSTETTLTTIDQSSDQAATTTTAVASSAFDDVRSEVSAVAAVAKASEPITVSSASDEAEGGPNDIEIPIGINYPPGQNSSFIYNPDTGEFSIDSDVADLRVVEVISAGELFTGTPANLSGQFDSFGPDKLAKVRIEPPFFGSLDFGPVLPTGLTETEINEDLTITGAPSIGGIVTSEDVLIDLRVTSVGGSPISSIQAGQEFILSAFVEDTSSGPIDSSYGGAFSAFIDVAYDSDLAVPVGDFEFGDNYTVTQSGEFKNDLLDEVGGSAASLEELGRDPLELFSLRMRAQGEGTLTFASNPADQLPAHEVTLYNKNSAIEPFRVVHDTASLSVTADPNLAPDLAAFAQALADSGAIMYGAAWCPHCTDQKELFEDGQEFLPFVEVTNPDRSRNEIGEQNNIDVYPTWVFGDGTREEGILSLEELSNLSGVSIPRSSTPIVIGLGDRTVFEGSPLNIPLNGYDPNGGRLTYSVTSSNEDLITVEPTSPDNRSLEIDVDGYGKMLFELFDERAFRATNQITALADTGFYEDVIFHRIIDNFMIQGGDPTGTGGGGSELDDFDDQFHVDLQHNQSGILSMAKSVDDSNNSQFFITDVPTRHLDGNHTIWGQLVEGDKNRDAITNTAVSGSRPINTIKMNSVTVIDDDIENGMVLLRPAAGATSGTSDITVTVTDQDGNSSTETFTVTVAPDTDPNANTPSWLDDIPELSTPLDEVLEFDLTAIDVEGDVPTFSVIGGGDQVTVDSSSGRVTVTPNSLEDITVTFRADSGDDNHDDQQVTITVTPPTPIINLSGETDSGASDEDNITNATTLDFGVSNIESGATVELFIEEGDGSRTKIGQRIDITGAATIVGTDSGTLIDDGTYTIVATQTIDNETSDASDPIVVTILRDIGEFQTSAPTDGLAKELITYDADHDDEGTTGFVYSLENAPAGASIDADTGVLTWTPTVAQGGSHDFIIRATDIAGNSVEQDVSIQIETPVVIGVSLEITDSAGNIIQGARTDTDFNLNVYVDDLRDESDDGFGVTQAYVDIDYDETLVSVAGEIMYGTNFTDNQTGDLTVPGIIDEAGASTTTATGPDRVLLFTIPMRTNALGSAAFVASAGDSNPFGIVGRSTVIETDELLFSVDDQLEIVNTLFAQNDSATIDEDSGPITIDVLVNDLPGDSSGDIVVTAIRGASGIDVTFTQDDVTYTPAADFSGQVTFEYDIDDGVETSTATVSISVLPINDPPVASDDSLTVVEDSNQFALTVLANDTDVDGDTLTIVSIDTDPTNGSATISSDGSTILYTPDSNFEGTDSLAYTVSDGNGFTDQANVTIDISEVNDPPIAVDDSFTTDEDTPISISVSELTGNDSAGANEDGQPLFVEDLMNAVNGTVDFSGTNTITFTPDANFSGTATFEYTLVDRGTSAGAEDFQRDTGLVSITVNAINDAPVAVDDVASTRLSAGTISIDVLANDNAGDVGDTLTISAVGATSNGGTAVVSGNQISYTPPAGFSGNETFTYTITDEGGLTSEATVSVSVVNFVENGVSGFAFYAANRGLSGVQVMLTGSDQDGNPVELFTRTSSDGRFTFSEVLPGDYTIRQQSLPFLVDGVDVIQNGSHGDVENDSFHVSVTADGLGEQTFNFSEQGLNPKFAIWEALASAGRNGVYIAIEPGESYMWAQSLAGWDDMTIVDVTLSANGNRLTIVAEDAAGALMEATVSTSDHTKVRSIGREGQAELIRIVGPASSFTFVESTGGAESENAVDSVFAGF